ncbi:MAG: nitrogen regulation protein NR(II) [Myxococcota bacterium]
MADAPAVDRVLASIPVGVLAVDAQGRCTLQNPEASRILGVSSETTRERELARVLGRDHPAVSLLREVRETGRPVIDHACELLQFPIGRPLMVDLCGSPLAEEGGSGPEGGLLTLTDRTVGRELEELVQLRQQTEAYARLAAGIAHEIRNPLGGILGASQLLEQRLEDPALAKYPVLIRDETARIRGLLDDLAQLTRGESLVRRPTNLHRVLEDLIELHSSDPEWAEVEFRAEYDPSIPELDLDPNRISQVVLNLLRNAAQATAGEGRVTIRTRVDTQAHLWPGKGGPRGVVQIEISDDGPGIDPSDLPHIFTPFFTRSARGTGLGLAIAQHWTVRHGGRIQVGAGSESGTCMRVVLPLDRSRPGAARDPR